MAFRMDAVNIIDDAALKSPFLTTDSMHQSSASNDSTSHASPAAYNVLPQNEITYTRDSGIS